MLENNKNKTHRIDQSRWELLASPLVVGIVYHLNRKYLRKFTIGRKRTYRKISTTSIFDHE